MTRRAPAEPPAVKREPGQQRLRRWLLFVHQLPPTPSNLRVRTWRRLQQLGALPLKQAVYVLPESPAAREDFEWLTAEVKGVGGDANVFAAETVDSWSDDALVEEFRRTRQQAYAALAEELERAVAKPARRRRGAAGPKPAAGRLVESFRQRLAALEQIDFFGSAGRDRVVSLLQKLEERSVTGSRRATDTHAEEPPRTDYSGRLWVTRPRPGVDRMGSAWLIRRFIDPAARFAFAPDRESLPSPDAVPFDMFGVEFSHRGGACTFETLCADFAIEDAAVTRIAAIVHDLDLKDDRFGPVEAGTVAAVIEGLQMSTGDDGQLLERGILLFESLYVSFARAARPAGPRRVARPRSAAAKAASTARRRPR